MRELAAQPANRAVVGFGDLPREGFARLVAAGQIRTYASGTDLMRQGDPSNAMYVILAGRVRVARTDGRWSAPVVLAELGPGEVIGEMGVLDGGPRSATVTAIEETTAAEVKATSLARIVMEHPEIYGSLLRVLSRRLRSTDELAAARGSRNDG